MEKLLIDFNDALSEYLGESPRGTIAVKERELSKDGKNYQLTALCRDNRFRLALFDEWGEAVPGFEVDCMGERLRVNEGEEAVDLGERSWIELSDLNLFVDGTRFHRLQVLPEPRAMTDDERDAVLETHLTWQAFYRLRTCPPMDVLVSGSPEAARHVEFCPTCRDASAGGIGKNAWAALAGKIKDALPGPLKPGAEPGQVWSLTGGLDGWDEYGAYVNAPQVLILSVRDGIRAVPCCPEERLAADSDVFLGDAFGFAEPWNRMVLPAGALRECWGNVGREALEAALKPAPRSRGEKKPGWRDAFEALEVRIAQTIERRALALEIAPQPLENRTSVKPWSERIMDVLRGFMPDFAMPDFAMAKDERRVVPLLVRKATGEVEKYEATITDWFVDADCLCVSGLMELPEDVIVSLVLAWFKTPEGDFVESTKTDAAGSYFQLEFPLMEGTSEHGLHLLAVRYEV